MKPRRGTKANPFEVGEKVLVFGSHDQPDIEGVILEIKNPDYFASSLFSKIYITYLVAYTINDKTMNEWILSRHLYAQP